MRFTFGHATIALTVIAFAGTFLSSQQLQPLSPAAPAAWESCEELHDTYVARFERSRGFGLTRMIQPLMLDRIGVLDDGQTQSSLESIELVGLLRADHPVVYHPTFHGQSIAPSGFKPRDLSAFEEGALAAFREGRGIARSDVDESGVWRCMGAVRAEGACLKCHTTHKAGDMLGAFTYQLKIRK